MIRHLHARKHTWTLASEGRAFGLRVERSLARPPSVTLSFSWCKGLAVSTGVSPDDRAPADAPDVFEPIAPANKKRMLIIVNPYATTVSDRLRHLVVYALQGRYEVDAVDTEARGHAIELCREAAHEGYDVGGAV